MLLIFVDETSDSKFKDYFGLSCTIINSNFYSQIKKDFQKTLLEAEWNPNIEFKGSCLFSATKGCKNIEIEKRIDIASTILALNVSNKNSRMKFYYLRKKSKNHKSDYLNYLPALLHKALPKTKRGKGKDLLSLSCDKRDDINKDELWNSIYRVIRNKSYCLFEDVNIVTSNFETVGILYADIVGYLSGRIDNINNDSELFQNIPKHELENNGKIKKLKSSVRLINLIKQIKRFKVNAQ